MMDQDQTAQTVSDEKDDPMVKQWHGRIKEAQKHWRRFHQRVKHNRKVVRGIDDSADPKSDKYNKDRANLIQSTLSVVLSKVYAKNPEIAGDPTNKARDLKLFADTVARVTQAMLEDAQLKKKAKASVRAALTCSYGIVKVQYQRDMRTDALIVDRIEDAQDNILRIESLIATIEDDSQRSDLETKKRELEIAVASMEEQKEVVAAEGLVIDRVRTDRLLIDPSVEDIWEYEAAAWMVECIPMRKSRARGLFADLDMDKATPYKVGDIDASSTERKALFSGPDKAGTDDPIVMVYEAWSKEDNTIYTLVDGVQGKFAREPYRPQLAGERWWPYFLLPFQSVDGEFVSQSLVDLVERLQNEHNETRDKFAEVRRNVRPHFMVSADVPEKSIIKKVHPEIGEYVVVDTGGAPLNQAFQQAQQLTIDPAVFDTSPIRSDWEMVSGLQDAARSTVISPKTATEASIMEQSLAARVSEFRDQIEDWLTEIAQYASELCLLAMTPQQVAQIMGEHTQDPSGEMVPAYSWPDSATPETVFNLVQMKIRAGSTAAPNKLQSQAQWVEALPVLQGLVQTIMQIEAGGGDGTPFREMLKETAARFDETIDVERFLPAKPQPPAPMMPPAMPAMGGEQLPPIPGLDQMQAEMNMPQGVPMGDPAQLPTLMQ